MPKPMHYSTLCFLEDSLLVHFGEVCDCESWLGDNGYKYGWTGSFEYSSYCAVDRTGIYSEKCITVDYRLKGMR
jgi:hypothetical protein